MKQTEFRVIFASGESETIMAFSRKEAAILGMAKQIERGNDYEVEAVIDVMMCDEYWFGPDQCPLCDSYNNFHNS